MLRVLLFIAALLPAAWVQTVATPTFLPVAGTSLTKFSVVVTCPTTGATLRYTVTGAEPTAFDPTVVSGQTVQVAQNMTLKVNAFTATTTVSNIEEKIRFRVALLGNRGTLVGFRSAGLKLPPELSGSRNFLHQALLMLA